jgi:hypothetical protein
MPALPADPAGEVVEGPVVVPPVVVGGGCVVVGGGCVVVGGGCVVVGGGCAVVGGGCVVVGGGVVVAGGAVSVLVGSVPGSEPGTDPGNVPGKDPGSEPGSELGTFWPLPQPASTMIEHANSVAAPARPAERPVAVRSTSDVMRRGRNRPSARRACQSPRARTIQNLNTL